MPESPFGRAMGFAGLGAGLVMGSLSDSLGRAWAGGSKTAQQTEVCTCVFVRVCACACVYVYVILHLRVWCVLRIKGFNR